MTGRVNLTRWQPHVEEARRRGVTLKAYAAEQGLSLYSLYGVSLQLEVGGGELVGVVAALGALPCSG